MLSTFKRAEHQIRYLNLHYPLQSEDPLSSQRKAVSLNAILNGTDHHLHDHHHKGADKGSSTSSLPPWDKNLRNHFTFKWARRQEGMR